MPDIVLNILAGLAVFSEISPMLRIVLPVALVLVAVALMAASGARGPVSRAEPAGEPLKDEKTSGHKETATFAAGCFWGVEAAFRKVPGVIGTQAGYTGGSLANPTYKQVCGNKTGHAEAVRIEYDPAVVSYQQLLEIFFEHHDPTTLNRQGPDIGTQYRSAVFFHTPEQEKLALAEKDKRNRSGEYTGPLVTEIVAAGVFYPAEEYHQQYFEKQGVEGECSLGNGKKRKAEAK